MKVFITRPIPNNYNHLFKDQNITVDVYEKDELCPREILLQRIKNVDAVITQVEETIDKEFFEAAGENLKVVANFATGHENIDIEEARKRNIIVTHTPTQELFWATAEAAVAMLLSSAKKVTKIYTDLKTGKAPQYSPVGNMNLAIRGKVTGIIGMGNIGTKVATMMHKGFNNEIIYFNRSAKPEYEKELKATKVELRDIFEKSDFIFITITKNKETIGLITKELLAYIKPTAVFVSTSPISIAEEKALLNLLRENKIFGVALDNYSHETTPFDDNRLILTADMASAEKDVTLEMTRLCVENVISVLEGEKPLTPIPNS